MKTILLEACSVSPSVSPKSSDLIAKELEEGTNGVVPVSTPRGGGVNRCTANLMN